MIWIHVLCMYYILVVVEGMLYHLMKHNNRRRRGENDDRLWWLQINPPVKWIFFLFFYSSSLSVMILCSSSAIIFSLHLLFFLGKKGEEKKEHEEGEVTVNGKSCSQNEWFFPLKTCLLLFLSPEKRRRIDVHLLAHFVSRVVNFLATGKEEESKSQPRDERKRSTFQGGVKGKETDAEQE